MPLRPSAGPAGRRPSSVRTAAAEDDEDGAQEQADVAPQAPVGDVEVVELDHLLERDGGPSEDLPQARDPRLEVEPPPPPAVDLAVRVERHRPRPNQAHLASQ